MIRLVVTSEGNPQDRIIGVLEHFDETIQAKAAAIAQEIYAELRPNMLSALQFYPPVSAGSKYIRTYRLRRGWEIDLAVDTSGGGLQIDLTVRNQTPYTKWVVGTLTNVDAVARSTQRAFHARNGWLIALDTGRYWFDQYKDQFVSQLTLAVEGILRQSGG